MLCPNCRNQVSRREKFCSFCGTPVPADPGSPVGDSTKHASFCYRCGNPIIPGDAFCGSCGAGIAPTPMMTQPIPPTEPADSVPPAYPERPIAPVAPEYPEEATIRTAPVYPGEATVPMKPSYPENPVTPVVPEYPETPVVPEDLGKANVCMKPAYPENPVTPVVPDDSGEATVRIKPAYYKAPPVTPVGSQWKFDPVPEERKNLCAYCGAECEGTDHICKKCRSAQLKKQEKPSSNQSKILIWILIGLTVLALAAGSFFAYKYFSGKDDSGSGDSEKQLSASQETTVPTTADYEETTVPTTVEHEETTAPTTVEIEETTEPTTAYNGPVTITFWQAGGDTEEAATTMRLLLDKFELMYPWITVDYQTIPWSMDPHTQFQIAIAGGSCADILVLGSPLDFQLAGEGNLMPLEDLLDPEILNDIPDVLLQNCYYLGSDNRDMYGSIMSVPLYTGNRALMYNKEIFDYFGAPYPTEGMSHADLLELAKMVTGTMNGMKVYGYGTRATTSEQYLNFVWNYGAQIVDPNTMTPGTNSEAWKKGINDYLAFYKAGVVPPGAETMSGTDLFSMFVNGGVAMFVGAVDYAQALGWDESKLGIAPLIGETYATCYAGADVIVVPYGTSNVEETALLLNYLMSPEVQATYCKIVGFFPGTYTALQDPYFDNDYIMSGFAETMSGAHYFDNFGVPGVGTILKENIQKLIRGEINIDQYQKLVTDQINERIKEMNSY